MKPSYYNCGAGSEIDCPNWDDINGCWCNCKEFGDENCSYNQEDNEDFEREFADVGKNGDD